MNKAFNFTDQRTSKDFNLPNVDKGTGQWAQWSCKMRVLRTLFIYLIFLISFHNCLEIECDWLHQWLCGDKCVNSLDSCLCGNDTITARDSRNYSCCNVEPCFLNFDKNVECSDGKKQNSSTTCEGKCMQDAEHGWPTLPCQNGYECYLKVYSCIGKPLCNE